MWNLKRNDTNELTYETESLTDLENKLMVARRAEWGEGIVREFEMNMYTCVLSHSAMFNSLHPHGLYFARFFCAWDCPGKNTGVGCHFLLQGLFPT